MREEGRATPPAVPQAKGTPGRRILIGVVAGAILYGGMARWADLSSLLETVETLPWMLVPAACALSFTNYVVRFPRWQRYLKCLAISLDRGTSFLVFVIIISIGFFAAA